MCAVSMVSDYGRDRVPREQWTRDSFDDFHEILRRLAKLDEKLNQPDCYDPTKSAWMEEVEQRLRKLETARRRKTRA